MRDGKGTQNRYSVFSMRDVELVTLSHIKERFKLVPKSRIAEEAARRASEVLEAYEADQGTEGLRCRQSRNSPRGASDNSPVSWNREEMPGGRANLLTGSDEVSEKPLAVSRIFWYLICV